MIKRLKLLALIALAYSSSSFAFDEIKILDLAPFSRIAVSGNAEVTVKQGKDQKVAITADTKTMPFLEIYVKGDELFIKKKSTGFLNRCPSSCLVKAEITVKELKEIDLSGSVKLKGQNIDADELLVDTAGSASVKLEGSARKLIVDASGSAHIDTSLLKAEIVEADASGSVDAKVHAEKELEVDISGSGQVRYSGNPAKVKTDVSGSGNVSKA